MLFKHMTMIFFFSIYTKILRSLSTKMMIFNSFIAVSGFNFGTPFGRNVFLPTKEKLGGICLALQWGHSRL